MNVARSGSGGEAQEEAAAAAPTAKTDETAPKPETRIAAIGDSDFAANSMLGAQGGVEVLRECTFRVGARIVEANGKGRAAATPVVVTPTPGDNDDEAADGEGR